MSAKGEVNDIALKHTSNRNDIITRLPRTLIIVIVLRSPVA